MNVSVGREFEEYVKQKVASGDYASASEVVRDGLRLLKEKDLVFEARLHALRSEIQKGVDQAEAGDLLDGPAVMAELRKALDNPLP
ncbi:MAG: type II toxin-antitoxin system ParD family antitoxin [Pseudomonadota bacterium]